MTLKSGSSTLFNSISCNADSSGASSQRLTLQFTSLSAKAQADKQDQSRWIFGWERKRGDVAKLGETTPGLNSVKRSVSCESAV